MRRSRAWPRRPGGPIRGGGIGRRLLGGLGPWDNRAHPPTYANWSADCVFRRNPITHFGPILALAPQRFPAGAQGGNRTHDLRLTKTLAQTRPISNTNAPNCRPWANAFQILPLTLKSAFNLVGSTPRTPILPEAEPQPPAGTGGNSFSRHPRPRPCSTQRWSSRCPPALGPSGHTGRPTRRPRPG